MPAGRKLGSALMLTLVVAAAGCGADPAGEAPAAKAATRAFPMPGGDVTIPADPRRVVATGYAVPALIEAGAKLAGISSWKRGLPMMDAASRATYDKLPKVAGETAAETNYEAIANARPDLIVIGVPAPVLADIDLERLRSIAPVVTIGPTIPSAWRELSQRQADAAGALRGLDTVKAAYEARAAELKTKYEKVLPSLKLAHVGSYGQVDKGAFHREFNGSWGTNIANDIGANYYGQVKVKGGGSKDVSEYPSIEELPAALGEADAVTYSVGADGKPLPAVQYVLDSALWKRLPAVKAGKVYPIRYTEAATYGQARLALDALDASLAPLAAK
ncbi:ABC transporter substrate-binding protein [Nonomuraea sp. NBC_01738]|uniref:ABC transporter substrate-binding protein n=1 Tax=Nonomuraea sp. NBC_01738 TaxID=2976003 RepID=UPI002E11B692|nr:ABC transporter substrate-binding protein [Nonomuraea sp. NBC_01738]